MKHSVEFIPMTHLDDFFIGFMTTPDAEDEFGPCRLTEFGFFLFKISILSYNKEDFNEI
jgi:hypothetical protein